jgi:hypothetical protein
MGDGADESVDFMWASLNLGPEQFGFIWAARNLRASPVSVAGVR